MDIAIAVCTAFPDPDPYDGALVPALAELGLTSRLVPWDDPGMDWASARLTLIRQTWDSHLRRDAFVAWAEQVERLTPLHNPAAVLRENTHKGYLRGLEAKGIPVTPTLWVDQGGGVDVAEVMRKRGWDTVVLKRAVSAGGQSVSIFPRARHADAQARLAELAALDEVMVQPYLETFDDVGERSYVFFDGVFSHAVHRPPMPAPGVFATPRSLPADDAVELRLAEQVVEALGRKLLYARVDLATDNAGRPRLQEVELTEPRLFLSLEDGAPAKRLARAIASRL